jgi:hypothetical protein
MKRSKWIIKSTWKFSNGSDGVDSDTVQCSRKVAEEAAQAARDWHIAHGHTDVKVEISAA